MKNIHSDSWFDNLNETCKWLRYFDNTELEKILLDFEEKDLLTKPKYSRYLDTPFNEQELIEIAEIKEIRSEINWRDNCF